MERLSEEWVRERRRPQRAQVTHNVPHFQIGRSNKRFETQRYWGILGIPESITATRPAPTCGSASSTACLFALPLVVKLQTLCCPVRFFLTACLARRMGGTASNPTPRGPVPEGKTRICVAGFGISHHTNRAGKLARAIQAALPDKYETWFYFDTKGYRPAFLTQIKSELPEEQQKAFAAHRTSPFCWLETTANGEDGKAVRQLDAKGGRDRLSEWAMKTFPDEKSITEIAGKPPSLTEFWVDVTAGTAQQGSAGGQNTPGDEKTSS